MNLINFYFTPFAAALVLVAIYLNEDFDRGTTRLSFAILGASLLINWWFARNTYRFVGRAHQLRLAQVWLIFVSSVLLFYLLFPFFAPAWLLVALPAVAAALHQGRWQTLATGTVSALAVLAVYRLRWQGEFTGPQLWAQAFVHAAFIPVLSLFVHALAQTALQMRDIRARL